MGAATLFFLLFFGQVYNFLTAFRTAALGFFLASFALNKQQMTGLIGTINMGVARGSTLVALGDNILGNTLSSAFVKDKILPLKLIVNPFFFYLSGVFDDPAF